MLWLLLVWVTVNGYAQPAGDGVENADYVTHNTVEDKNKKSKIPAQVSFLPEALPTQTTFDIRQKYQPHSGRYIRAIVIITGDTNKVTIEHPARYKGGPQKEIPGLRFGTPQWSIWQYLLFRYDEFVDPDLFADTEFRLRNELNIKDANIWIETAGVDDEVIVYVYGGSIWSWKFRMQYAITQVTGSFDLINFFNLPHRSGTNLTLRADIKNPVHFNQTYKFSNILGSNIDAKASFDIDKVNTHYGGLIKRDFYSYKVNWAGRVRVDWFREKIEPTGYPAPFLLRYNKQDIWLARSFHLRDFGITNERVKWILSGRLFRTQYTHRPVYITSSENQRFQQQRFYLLSTGIATIDYYVDKHVFYFGDYEYLPKGLNVSFITGLEYLEELRRRFYTGFIANYSHYLNNLGFVFTQFAYGGFLAGNRYEQLGLKAELKYITRKMDLREWGWRNFIYSSLYLGFNRPEGQEITINDGAGIRGFKSKMLKGTKSTVVNLESVIYSPIVVWGFQTNLFAFADFALLGRRDAITSLFESALHQGYGFGFRFHNKKLGLPFIEFSFAWYPEMDDDVNAVNYWFDMEHKRVIHPASLLMPSVVKPDVR